MKPSKIRKMKREMANAHNVKRGEIQRVTNAMYKVGHNFKLKFQTAGTSLASYQAKKLLSYSRFPARLKMQLIVEKAVMPD